MKFSKVVKDDNEKLFEGKINNVLQANEKASLLNLSSNVYVNENGKPEYIAILIFELKG